MSFNVEVADFVPFEGVGALSNVPTALRNGIYSAAPPITIDITKTYRATFETTAGQMLVNLFAVESPIAVNSFVNLARDGFFDGIDFHRVIDEFVAQGGDPLGTGRGGPGYVFDNETANGLSFDRVGLLAMANAGANTNGSQFFFTKSVAQTAGLTGGFTIFGEILGDQAALRNIELTHVVLSNGTEEPIPGVVPTRINSVTIEEL